MTRVHLGVLQEVSIYMVSADGRCLVIGSVAYRCLFT